MDTYELDAVAEALGLKSKHAARKRVHEIRDVLEKRNYIVYDTHRGNALTVTLDGLNLLQRMNEFPGSISDQGQALRIELGDVAPPPDAEEVREFKQAVREWRAQHRDDHKALELRLERLENRRGIWVRFRDMISPPNDEET